MRGSDPSEHIDEGSEVGAAGPVRRALRMTPQRSMRQQGQDFWGSRENTMFRTLGETALAPGVMGIGSRATPAHHFLNAPRPQRPGDQNAICEKTFLMARRTRVLGRRRASFFLPTMRPPSAVLLASQLRGKRRTPCAFQPCQHHLRSDDVNWRSETLSLARQGLRAKGSSGSWTPDPTCDDCPALWWWCAHIVRCEVGHISVLHSFARYVACHQQHDRADGS